MNSYVVGSSGFLGRHLCEWFAKFGPVVSAPSFTAHDGSREEWMEAVLDAMDTASPDLVLIPGASQAGGDDSQAIDSLITSNCILPARIAQRLCERHSGAKVVVFGSSWQFADSDTFRPFNLYAASKQAGIDLLQHYALNGLKILALILFDTYGEDDVRRKLLNILVAAAEEGEAIDTTRGEQEIDLVHVDDVCQGVELAVEELSQWDTNEGVLIRGIGSGDPITVNELIERIARKVSGKLRVNLGGREYRSREVMHVYRGYEKPRGWKPQRHEYQKSIDE